MQIRPVQENDYSQLPALISELGYSPGSRLQEIFLQIINSSSMGILVAESGIGQIEGFLSYSLKPQLRLNGCSMEIDELIVSSSSRGKGIGALLLKAIKEIAVEKRCSRITLNTNRERESYQRDFYKKNGFIELNGAFLKMDL